MKREVIPIESFNTNIFQVFNKEWMLLTGGDLDSGEYNPMTIAWGFMGTMWFKPVVIVAVRPQRYTLEFLEKYNTFTLSGFGEDKKEALSFCGAHSGRELNKINECSLTPMPAEKAGAPAFEEAELVIECRKLYYDQLKGKNFIDKSIIGSCYPDRDFHIMFAGEVLAITGKDKHIR
jgi:flavin reductase (DIM6/NTAB) family NADH-FMN oxidoreductase RutF